MAGYIVGTEAWAKAIKIRLLEISEMLKNPDTSREERDDLYEEEIRLILALYDWRCENGLIYREG